MSTLRWGTAGVTGIWGMRGMMGLAMLAASLAANGQEPGTAIKQDDIKAEPFKDAKTVAVVKKGESVSILQKQGGWMEIKTEKGSGWVRILSVRRGGAAGGAASEIAGVAGVATGRTGTGQVTSTTGVRGLGEEDLKSAKFSEEEIKSAESAAVPADEARQFAAAGQLSERKVDWLPQGKTSGGGAR